MTDDWTMAKPMFYDPAFESPEMVVRYAVGGQEREVVVLTNGRSFEDHVGRLQSLSDSPIDDPETYVPWPLAGGGAVAIRLDSIVALEARPNVLP